MPKQVRKPRSSTDCMDCKRSIYDKCPDGISGYAYMLKNPLWQRLTKKTKGKGFLCWTCAQQRHGIGFVRSDLRPCPCSYRRLLALTIDELESARQRRLLRRVYTKHVALECGIVEYGNKYIIN